MDHYSSLFTMGLLSERGSPVSSPAKSNFFSKFRKSSLPTKALSKPSEMHSRGDGHFYLNNAPPPQFTNPFGDSPEATNELRSFLSLDLAADRTARRSSKFLSPLDTSAPPAYSANVSPHQHVPDMAPLSAPRRPSRDSLRTLPSPGPAPSSSLPDIPSEREYARNLPPIIIPDPSLFPLVSLSSSPGGGFLRFPQPPHSAPPTTYAPSSDSPSFVSSPSPTLSPSSPFTSRRAQQHASFISLSSNATSVRTARRRHAARSNALACLEGLSRAPGRIPRNTRQNFMSMSDDEDEEAMNDTDVGKDADVEDESDALATVPPVPSPLLRSARTRVSSFVLPASLPGGYLATDRSPIDEEEDCVLPPAAISALKQTSPSKLQSRSRRSTLESWFPLANFIDLKDEDLSNWRGVVEILNGL
ncbi:hypothetical protein EDB84DRAFT_1564884 [Lactarius hengduanensis]|nr:hypothetical protein EDB84DRAFT_1564884 [Lactarius hengduanensis]